LLSSSIFFLDQHESCFLNGVDYEGSDLHWYRKLTSSAKDCQTHCFKESKCEVWTWDKKKTLCYPKSKEAVSNKKKLSEHISGPKKCPGMLNTFFYKHLLQAVFIEKSKHLARRNLILFYKVLFNLLTKASIKTKTDFSIP
jgi:hypothetical protein